MAAALVTLIALAALPAGAGTLPTSFGGPTVDVRPGNASPGYKRTQDLPIAVRLSADRTRIAELDWALISACNFEARIDWGTLTDFPSHPTEPSRSTRTTRYAAKARPRGWT